MEISDFDIDEDHPADASLINKTNEFEIEVPNDLNFDDLKECEDYSQEEVSQQ